MAEDFDEDLRDRVQPRTQEPARQPAEAAASGTAKASASRQHLLQRIQEMGFEASRQALAPDSALVKPGAGMLSPDAQSMMLRGATGSAVAGAAAGMGGPEQVAQTGPAAAEDAGPAPAADTGDGGAQIGGAPSVDVAEVAAVGRDGVEAARKDVEAAQERAAQAQAPGQSASDGAEQGASDGAEAAHSSGAVDPAAGAAPKARRRPSSRTPKAPVPKTEAPPEPSQEELLAKEVAEAAMRWSLSMVGEATAALEVATLATQAGQAMSQADLKGVESARAAIGTTLTRFAALIGERKAEMDHLASKGAKVQPLHDLCLKGYVTTLGALLDPRYVANPFVPRVLQGNRGPIGLQGYRGGIPIAAQTGDPAADVAAALANADQLIERFRPILDQVPIVRRWAQSLDPARAPQAWLAAQDVTRGPLKGLTGREREILQAIAIDAAPPEWAPALRSDERKLAAQIQAEDTQMQADGWGKPPALDAERFKKLDAAARTLAAEANSTYVDDKVAMAALDTASTPAEREYLLRRLRDLDVYNTLYHGLDAGNQRAFDAKRADAGNFSGTAGQAGKEVSVGRAAGQAARMLPGATYATLVGAGQAIPILGDVIEDEWGDEARKTVLAIHRAAGVDAESAALSADIATGTGKIAASIGFAGVGGPGAATTRVGKGIGRGLEAIDTVNDLGQAVTGKTITGEEISDGERVAAALGPLLGGVADTAGKGAKAARSADIGSATSGASKGAKAARSADIGVAAAGASMEVNRGWEDGSEGPAAPSKKAEVLARAGDWVGRNPGHPLAPLVREAMAARDVERLEALFQ